MRLNNCARILKRWLVAPSADTLATFGRAVSSEKSVSAFQ